MKTIRFSLGAVLALFVSGVVHAETDYIALGVIKDIQAGKATDNSIVNLYTANNADITGDLTVGGSITGSGATGWILANGASIVNDVVGDVNVVFTNATATLGQLIVKSSSDASGLADGDVLEIQFESVDSASNATIYATVRGQLTDVTTATEDGEIELTYLSGGSTVTGLVVGSTAGGTRAFTVEDTLVFSNATMGGVITMSNGEMFDNTTADGHVMFYGDGDEDLIFEIRSPNSSDGEAELRLVVDANQNAGDAWRILHDADDSNKLEFDNNTSGSFVNKLTIGTDGTVTFVAPPVTTFGAGAVVAAVASVVENGDGVSHQSIITFTNVVLPVADGGFENAVKVYDFPVGRILIEGVTIDAVCTHANTNFNTSAADLFNMGMGTTTNDDGDGTMSATSVNFIPETSIDSDDGQTQTNTWKSALAVSAQFDGTTTAGAAVDLYVSTGIPAANDNGATTNTVTGSATVTWKNLGDN